MSQASGPADTSILVPESRPPRIWSFKIAQTVIVERPLAEVFAFRCFLASTPEWRRGVVSASVDSMGPIGVGTRCTELRTGSGESREDWEIEVTGYEPSALLGIVNRCGAMEVCECHQFASSGPATRYTVSADVTGSLLPSSAYQKVFLATLLQMKWALEGVPNLGLANTRRRFGS